MSDVVKLPVPPGIGAPGRALWDAVSGTYELEVHETLMLHQAAVVADRIAALDEIVDAEGVIDSSGHANRALVESRQQRLVLARLLTALRLPDQLGQSPQHRGLRGFYGPREVPGGAA